jgi:hypothetical protein
MKTYMLRTCNADMTSSNGFIWPASGPVECPDWDPIVECGYGLHGLLMGVGAAELLDWSAEARWLVVEIDEFVDLGDKIKVPHGIVVYAGDRRGATQKIIELGADPAVVPGAVVIVGDGGTATAGYRGTAIAGDDGGTATAGHRGTATAGDYGTAIAGDSGTATAGYRGTAIAGDGGTATAGHRGTATAGNYGTAIAGDSGTATAGHRGTATAGYGGAAIAGDGGTATAGHYGTAIAGEGGIIQIRWYSREHDRYFIETAYPGINGIFADTAYRLDDETHEFVAADKTR